MTRTITSTACNATGNESKKQYRNQLPHSITFSALTSTFGGIVNPICFADFKLIANSNFVGCSTGSPRAWLLSNFVDISCCTTEQISKIGTTGQKPTRLDELLVLIHARPAIFARQIRQLLPMRVKNRRGQHLDGLGATFFSAPKAPSKSLAPLATASPMAAMTMGMLSVSFIRARIPGEPEVTRTSGLSRTNSAARTENRSIFPCV
jgi:hypothetical protein